MLVALGCKTLVVTNAAGGVDATLAAGDIVILSRSLNLLGGSPLRGPNDETLGPRFPDMTEAYDAKLRALAAAAGRDVGLTLREGVYAALAGPAVRDAGRGAHAARRSAPISSACRRCPR